VKVDWVEVERLAKPSPNYEDIPTRLNQILAYTFVREHYNHHMIDAQAYARALIGGDPKQRYGEWLTDLIQTLQKLNEMDIVDYVDFVCRVETREKFESFYKGSKLNLNEIIGLLKYLLYWALPSRVYLRELIDKEDAVALSHITRLRENGIRFTLDVLEKGLTKRGRKEIAHSTTVPEDFIYDMVNRADFTRLPYIRGSSIRHYFNIGYTTIDKLSEAEYPTLRDEMAAYSKSIGKDLSRVIELDSGIAIAKIIPKLVEHE
jgi:hypothetical protein